MLGLSITAIGRRGLAECLQIYDTLKDPLQLDYLELAVGTRCDLDLIPKEIPLVIHHQCLYQGSRKFPFSLSDRRTWATYKLLLQGRNVLMFSVHPPKKNLFRGDEMALREVTRLRAELEEYLSIPTCLEVMPNNAYWLAMGDCLWIDKSVPLLLDISHINIWAQGKEYVTKRWVEELLPQSRGIHLSHNNGREDSHELIPKDIWFNPYIKEWAQKLFVTYESLPEEFAEYERLDKKEKKTCNHFTHY